MSKFSSLVLDFLNMIALSLFIFGAIFAVALMIAAPFMIPFALFHGNPGAGPIEYFGTMFGVLFLEFVFLSWNNFTKRLL